MLKKGSRIGLVGCSNAQPESYAPRIKELLGTIEAIGLRPVLSDFIYEREGPFSGTGRERAQALNGFFESSEIEAIFDISGGELANGVLEYLDFEAIKRNPKPFFGYSDLSTVINAIYAKTGAEAYLYQIRNLIYSRKDTQIADFTESILNGKDNLYKFEYEFVRGSCMRGVVIGGNIRCFLKLAGTGFMPAFDDRILFLESLHGDVTLMTTLLTQLRLLGAFLKIKGLLLGTFTAMEKDGLKPPIEELVVRVAEGFDFPIARTRDIGHGSDSKCIVIGREYVL